MDQNPIHSYFSKRVYSLSQCRCRVPAVERNPSQQHMPERMEHDVWDPKKFPVRTRMFPGPCRCACEQLSCVAPNTILVPPFSDRISGQNDEDALTAVLNCRKPFRFWRECGRRD